MNRDGARRKESLNRIEPKGVEQHTTVPLCCVTSEPPSFMKLTGFTGNIPGDGNSTISAKANEFALCFELALSQDVKLIAYFCEDRFEIECFCVRHILGGPGLALPPQGLKAEQLASFRSTVKESHMETWNFQRIESLIVGGVEESLSLDYKAAGALQRDDRKRAEITKDVSAMANSAGGVVIYGIREHQDKAKAHLPEAIDAVSRNDFPKEWLEHVIQNIRPRIEGIVIHPVSIPHDPDGVVYVVEIPQSSTAHQATDFRYYRRFNFESVMMHDYEIRDVMARRQHPIIEVAFHILYITRQFSETGLPGLAGKKRGVGWAYVCAVATNKGRRLANHVSALLSIPKGILMERYVSPGEIETIEGFEYHRYEERNIVRDVVGRIGEFPKYGEHRVQPILPELSHELGSWDLHPNGFKERRAAGAKILWEASADDAPKRHGEVLLGELKIVDKRSDANEDD